MGTGNSALFEVSSNSTCCKFFSAGLSLQHISAFKQFVQWRRGVKGHSALGAFQKHLLGFMDAMLLVARVLLSQVLSQNGHCTSIRASVLLE